jgi:hypothetical protein
VELSVKEQRYQAVLEVLSSLVPVTEVAERYRVSRQTVHAWLWLTKAWRPASLKRWGSSVLGLASGRPYGPPSRDLVSSDARICR